MTIRSPKNERPPKIFVVYKDGSVGTYKSEAKAITRIREHDEQGSEVRMAIIGHELGMVASTCEVIHCFCKKGSKLDASGRGR